MSLRGRIDHVSEGQWWFCLKHMRVEPEKGCPNKDRMGPYSTEQEAAGALQRAADRNKTWEEADQDEE
ncbi:hypothetical protein E1286_38110 [Nonomuraea terrae]|uniref:SPOR domain-containing protein n=1 Tax=Nonomuraea terrae TaxID=2530383 RepID=A0A4V2YIX4_9ACTN|nr:hypothetical protein [Nonomuraea terrae]TDD36667.1 hypothetical protein E1286_38110 [Nonomuraea terrae]